MKQLWVLLLGSEIISGYFRYAYPVIFRFIHVWSCSKSTLSWWNLIVWATFRWLRSNVPIVYSMQHFLHEEWIFLLLMEFINIYYLSINVRFYGSSPYFSYLTLPQNNSSTSTAWCHLGTRSWHAVEIKQDMAQPMHYITNSHWFPRQLQEFIVIIIVLFFLNCLLVLKVIHQKRNSIILFCNLVMMVM